MGEVEYYFYYYIIKLSGYRSYNFVGGSIIVFFYNIYFSGSYNCFIYMYFGSGRKFIVDWFVCFVLE